MMSASRHTGKKKPRAFQLSLNFRWAIYGTFWILFLTGVIWPVADSLKDGPNGETWQAVAANLLMWHGGVAMISLLLLGALVPIHIQRAWRSHKNRLTGSAMATFNAVLIATAFGLYYLGSDALRPWFSNVHLVIGIVLPVLFAIHIVVGKRAT